MRGSQQIVVREGHTDNHEEDGEDCTTLFRRSDTDKNVKFDDFKIISIVGKGTFGKVYLV